MLKNDCQAGTADPQSTAADVTLSSPTFAKPLVSRSLIVKPMLFSTPMVQAILESRKTQTRRILKAGFDTNKMFYKRLINHNTRIGCQAYFSDKINCSPWLGTKVPFQIGNIIWVRETFAIKGNRIFYKADNSNLENAGLQGLYDFVWKSSMFMPKNVCRLFLEVTDVRVQRIQDISNNDCKAEGIMPVQSFNSGEGVSPIQMYENYLPEGYTELMAKDSVRSLWVKINGLKSWYDNPFVWAYTFKVVECPQGFC